MKVKNYSKRYFASVKSRKEKIITQTQQCKTLLAHLIIFIMVFSLFVMDNLIIKRLFDCVAQFYCPSIASTLNLQLDIVSVRYSNVYAVKYWGRD